MSILGEVDNHLCFGYVHEGKTPTHQCRSKTRWETKDPLFDLIVILKIEMVPSIASISVKVTRELKEGRLKIQILD